ncbi:hypothetical protein AB0230_08805 [Microbacterium sp. NPDC089190]|uniref:hypothetical protein n=1 Tax=Microbacterium sp. NPDC089190 TaxID=3155063 RepID=UPI00344D2063
MLTAMVRDVTMAFHDELQLYGAWVESPTSVCVVYRRTIDENLIFGRRITFPPHAVDDDPGSTGADVAQTLLEPPGDAMDRARIADGVLWLWVQPDEATPVWPGTPLC